MARPTTNEHPENIYFSRYINKIASDTIIEVLEKQMTQIVELFGNLTPEQECYSYAPDKWSLKQVLGHITDTERIFAYRLLCIARNDKQSLLGFNENDYVSHASFQEQTLVSLIQQYHYNRLSTLALLKSTQESQLSRIGNANGSPVSARALAYMIAGHELHHLEIIATKYLV